MGFQQDRVISNIKTLNSDVERLKAMKQAVALQAGHGHSHHMGKISVVNSTSPKTYDVAILVGNDLASLTAETGWTIPKVLSSDPNVSYIVGDYVILLLNDVAPHFIMAGGGSSGSGSSGVIVGTGWLWP